MEATEPDSLVFPATADAYRRLSEVVVGAQHSFWHHLGNSLVIGLLSTAASVVLGTLGGAVIGAAIGNQVGGGSGQKIATVVGAVGGAVAGNEVEKRVKSTKNYEITVRLDDGSTRMIQEANPPSWRNGDHVRIVDGTIRAN